MMKFDHSYQLPPKLLGRYILPLKNGLYAIIKGQGYHQPEHCGQVIDFPRETQFELKTTSTGISEMQHLDIAFNSGLLGHFLKEPILYPTIRGRKRSPQFRFEGSGHQLEVQGVQVEIDGGFEGRHSVTVVEAKIGESEDFHLRQLYYPFRFWSAHTTKKIRPVFFTYEPEAEVYRFREYLFDPVDVYGSPHLVQAAAYRIVPASSHSFSPLTEKNDFPFPQADRLDKIALIPFVAAEGHTSAESLAEIFEFSPRQGRYYIDACKSLGLLDKEGNPTQFGLQYIACTPEMRYRLLCRCVLKLPVLSDIITNLLLSGNSQLSKEEVEVIVSRATSLAPSTAKRRTQTVWSWLTWLSVYVPFLSVTPQRLSLEKHSPQQAALFDVQQLDLF